MTTLSGIVFLHVISALAIASALSLEGLALHHMRGAAGARDARASIDLAPGLPLIFAASAILILVTGAYLTVQTSAWPQGWLKVSIAALILLAPFGAISGRRMRAIRRLSAADREHDAELIRKLQDPVLTLSLNCRMALVLGIVLLMTAKPDLRESIGVGLMSLVAGFASAVFWRTGPSPIARVSSGSNR